MATLESLIGVPLHELPEDQITDFVENLRSTRQQFTEGAYEERKFKRKSSAKRQTKQMTPELLAEIDSLMEELDL